MDLASYASQMARNAETIRKLVQEVSAEQARWKPDPDTWSLLEVINHLYDEEREDFRVRLTYILTRSGEPWPGIDPGGWVKERAYNERDLRESLANYLEEREKSLDWLGELEEIDWDKADKAPWGGEIRAGDMFAAWVAHDLLHTRQLIELHWAYLNKSVEPYLTLYAGEW